jgi:hypothetical protein
MGETTSIRESLEAAQAQLAGDEVVAAPVTAAPEPAAPEAAAPDAVSAEPVAGQERDEHGRFKPKTQEAQAGAETATPEPEQETAATAEPEPQPGTIRIPHALPAPLKAEFGELPEKWREAFIKQEDSIKAFKDEQAPKAARLNRYDEIIGPHLDKWRYAGLDEFTGIQTLIAAQNLLERNPVEGLVHIARSYSIHPQQIAQALGLPQTAQTTGTEGQPAPTAQPDLSAALQPYLQRVQTLEQRLEQSAQATQQAEIDRLTAEVEAFQNDPANIYFHNVEADMVTLLQAKAATSLKDAYEKAIWASPEIRPLLLKAQSAAEAKKPADDAARAKAAAAKQASGSLTGAPSPGAQAPKAGSLGSIRADLEAAQALLSASA